MAAYLIYNRVDFEVSAINPFLLEDPRVHGSVLSCSTGLPPYMAETEEECSVSLRQVHYVFFLVISRQRVNDSQEDHIFVAYGQRRTHSLSRR